MKKSMISYAVSTLLIVVPLGMLGCSSSSDSGETDTPTATVVIGAASVSGTVATPSSGISASSSFGASAVISTDETTSATLVVDLNANGVFGDEGDSLLNAVVNTDGAFDFGSVDVSKTVDTKALMTVVKQGYSPYTKIITLSDTQTVSVVADAASTPLQREVVNLSDLRAAGTIDSSFLKLGTKNNGVTLSSYARILSFSQMQAEADVPLSEDVESESIIPLSAIPESVTVINADMQTFDPTDPADAANFPGDYVGVGENGSDAGQRLVSVGFDYMSLTDQNGNPIELDLNALSAASKLLPQAVDYSQCLRTSTRYLSGAQLDLFAKYGDDDNTTTEFEIPLWYYNNNAGNWQYLGQAEVYGEDGTTNYDPNGGDTYAYAKMCITENWGTSLNLDYSFAPELPSTVCFKVVDQDDKPISNLSVISKKDTAYETRYLDSDGKATLALLAGNDASTYDFSYRGSLTGWYDVPVQNTNIVDGGEEGCDNTISIEVVNPYSATVKLNVKELDGSVAANKTVHLTNSSWSEYYYKSVNTDENGLAVFKVKPNTPYIAKYAGTTANVNVNDAVVSPELADDGRYATLNIQELEVAPIVYIRIITNSISDTSQSVNFSVNGSDRNGDVISLSSLKLNGTILVEGTDYTINRSYSYKGYSYFIATLNLDSATVSIISPASLVVGNYTLEATYSDGKTTGIGSRGFSVNANLAPVVSTVYLSLSGEYSHRLSSDSLLAGTHRLYAYSYDPNGDAITNTYTLNGNSIDPSSFLLTNGSHTLVVTATEVASAGLEANKIFTLFVGNSAPEITSFGASTYSVNVASSQTVVLYAYAKDKENSILTVQTTDGNITLSSSHSGSNYFVSTPLTINADTTFTIVANDGDKNSTAKSLTVTTYEANQPPVFEQELLVSSIALGVEKTFICEATDPDGLMVSYSWKLDEVEQSETSTTFTTTFNTSGSYVISCTATDGDINEPASVTSTASVIVYDPSASGNLVINTMPGLLVAIHDTTTLEPIESKIADSAGTANFIISGTDRTTFSVSVGPDTIMDANILFREEKEMSANIAAYWCSLISDDVDTILGTECSTYNINEVLAGSTIANWIFEINGLNRVNRSDGDTNGDGAIDSSEYHVLLLDNFDSNEDGALSWSEWNRVANIKSDFFVNVPVRTYNINLDGYTENYAEYENALYYALIQREIAYSEVTFSGFEANSYINALSDFNLRTSLDSNGEGSFSGWNYAQNDGLYSNLFSYEDNNGTLSYMFDKDKTASEIKNISYTFDDFTLRADTNVSIVGDLYIDAYYKGVHFDLHSLNDKYLNNSNFNYKIRAYDDMYDYTTGSYIDYAHNGYYGDGILKSFYDASEYPHLDITPTLNTSGLGSVDFSGEDLSKVNYAYLKYDSWSAYDTTTNLSINVHVTLNYTVIPSSVSMPNLESIIPLSISQHIPANRGYETIRGAIVEFKDLTEIEFLDMLTSLDNSYDEDDNFILNNYNNNDYYNIARRSIYFNIPTSTTDAFSTVKRVVKPKYTKPFTIGYDIRKSFEK